MNLPFNLQIGRRRPPDVPQVVRANASQTRDSWADPLKSALTGYIDLKGNLDLFDTMRSALPILDVAVIKRAGLIGDFKLVAEDKRTQEFLDWYVENVRVGWFGRGLSTWLRQMIDSTLAKGFSVGELVPDVFMRSVDRLKVARANEFRFAPNEQTGRLDIVQVLDGQLLPIKLENQDLIHYLAFDLRDGHPQGVSMFSSLPFMAEIVARINKAMDNAIWRIGDPTFLGVYTAGERDTAETVKANVNTYVTELTEAMKSRKLGKVTDLAFGVAHDGKFEVSILGGNYKMPDISVPLKSVLEQIVARTGLPPYMFGLSWSTTERMSKEQSDMLVAEIQSERELLDPIIERVVGTGLILQGYAGAQFEIEWNDVNLMDEVQQAQAEAQHATAINTEVAAMMQLLNAGFDVSEALVGLAERAGWIEDGQTISREARVEQVRQEAERRSLMRDKIALLRVAGE